MFAAVAVIYLAFACATVVPPPFTQIGAHPGQQPAPPSWAIACTWLNEVGVQKHPSLNP